MSRSSFTTKNVTVWHDVVHSEDHVEPKELLRLVVGDLAEFGPHFADELGDVRDVKEADGADEDVQDAEQDSEAAEDENSRLKISKSDSIKIFAVTDATFYLEIMASFRRDIWGT